MSTRKQRGLNERIYLLDAKNKNKSWELTVKGSSKSIYKILLSANIIKCKCMDFSIRKKVCKHLYFILGRIIKNNQNINNIENIDDIKINYYNISNLLKEVLHNHVESSITDIEYDVNDTCCICFESFNNESVSQCTKTCKNTFHSECINLWLSNNDSCPLCRSPWIDSNSDNPLEEFKGITIS